MFSKKFALFLSIAMLLGLQYSKIEVPENAENPMMLKILASTMSATDGVAKIASYFNYGTRISIFRRFFDFIATKLSNNNIDKSLLEISNTKITNVNVRIYTPRTLSSQTSRPVLIYYHGGAYLFGGLNIYDAYLTRMSIDSNIMIISVDYKLAPEHPYPEPINDCHSVAKYVLNNAAEFGINPERLVLAGDSAGGNAAAVVSQRLLVEKEKHQPKLQVLIYPWTQMVNSQLPSRVRYFSKGLFTSFTVPEVSLFYLGIKEVTNEAIDAVQSGNITLLLDESELNKLKSHLNTSLIPDEFKQNRAYYELSERMNDGAYPTYKLDENNMLVRDRSFVKLVKNLFSSDISPLLADEQQLRGLPKAYVLVCELDQLKDEGIMYAKRLQLAGVPVDIKYYTSVTHGMAHMIKNFNVSKQMLEHLVDFLKKNI